MTKIYLILFVLLIIDTPNCFGQQQQFDLKLNPIFKGKLAKADSLIYYGAQDLIFGHPESGLPLFTRALLITEKVAGKNSSETTSIICNIASCYKGLGEYQKAEQLYLQALKTDIIHNTGTANLARDYSLLGFLYLGIEKYAKAKSEFHNCSSVKNENNASGNLIDCCEGLGRSFFAEGELDSAKFEFNEGLRIEMQTSHPFVDYFVLKLADVARLQGKYEEAISLYNRYIDSSKRLVNRLNQRSLEGIIGLAKTYLQIGDISKATGWIDTSAQWGCNINLAISAQLHNQKGEALALSAILRQKNFEFKQNFFNLENLRRYMSPDMRLLLDSLTSLRTVLSNEKLLERVGPHWFSLSEKADSINNVLETYSSTLILGPTKKINIAVSIENIERSLPNNAALLEIYSYSPFNLKPTKGIDEWLPEHYMTYVLTSDGNINWIDLGLKASLDSIADNFKESLEDIGSLDDMNLYGNGLFKKLIVPVQRYIQNKTTILFAPDGKLNTIPISAIVDNDGNYLINRYDITYINSEEELLHNEDTMVKTPVESYIVADPEFGNVKGASNITLLKYRSVHVCDPLPLTSNLVDSIKALIPEIKVLTKQNATANNVKKIEHPYILHLATHGFFLKTDTLRLTGNSSEIADVSLLKRKSDDPMLRSLIALTGANDVSSLGNKGLLTALEVQGMNLEGTELVILSGCETGEGDLLDHEGIFGLRRAFALAGAKSQVITLWRVNDTASCTLMMLFYKNLIAGMDKSEALRQTQISMIHSKWGNPYYWAAFIQSGNWESMNFNIRLATNNNIDSDKIATSRKGIIDESRINIDWVFKKDDRFSSIVAYKNILYASTEKGILYALEEKTGKLIWSINISTSLFSPNEDDKIIISKMTFSGNVLLLSAYFQNRVHGGIVAVNTDLRKVLWVCNTETINYSAGLSVKNGLIYFGYANYVTAVDLSIGTVVWTTHLKSYINTAPIFSNDTMFIGTGETYSRTSAWHRVGMLYAFDYQSGKILDTLDCKGEIDNNIEQTNGNLIVPVSIGNDVHNIGKLLCIKKKGFKIEWEHPLDKGLLEWRNSTLTKSGIVYGTDRRRLFALNEKTGDLLWQYDAYFDDVTKPVLKDNKIYFGTNEIGEKGITGRLYEYSLNKGTVQNIKFNEDFNQAPIQYEDKLILPMNGAIYLLSTQR